MGRTGGPLPTLDETLFADEGRMDAFIGRSGPYGFDPFTEDDHRELFGAEEA